MKTLLTIFTFFTLTASAFAAKADGSKTSGEKLSLKYAANAFIEAFIHGKSDGFAEILDNNVKLTTSRGNTTITYNKASIIQMLKDSKGVEQNCKTDYSVIESLPSQVILKVNMKYESFRKINYVTMTQTSKGWKVSNISSVFQ